MSLNKCMRKYSVENYMTVPLRLCIAEIEIAFGDVRFFPLFLAKYFGKSYRYTLHCKMQHSICFLLSTVLLSFKYIPWYINTIAFNIYSLFLLTADQYSKVLLIVRVLAQSL